ncbi:MAG: hypothetical protein PVG15_16990 [Desulfobacterales bacterium]|jgi:hypothetical protein
MKRIFIISILISFFITSCASSPKTEKTQLQIRSIQTRTYETPESKLLLKAMLNVLQDDGFIVKTAVPELGLLTATKEIDIENASESIPAFLFGGANARWKKNSIIEATCNISDFRNGCKVRVNFTQKILDNLGGILAIKQIYDQKFYQAFFLKVDKSIYIQRMGL